MTQIRAYAAMSAGAPLTPWTIERRPLGEHDVLIETRYAGICHSDIHQAREEWGPAIFPMVPGHEIVGHVSAVGSKVTRHAVGDAVGVGCYVNSCRTCTSCLAGEEEYCLAGPVWTYNSREADGTPTYGGYSTHIVVDENYALRMPPSLPLDAGAPLLCAGITLYTPLSLWGCVPGASVGIVGLGGLGHMGVKIAVAMGAQVTVISHSPGKREDAARLGAQFIDSSDRAAMKAARMSFDLIVDTVSADHDIESLLGLLRVDGTLALVGLPSGAFSVHAGPLVGFRRRLVGSSIGGLERTQEMLDFCAEHGITSDIEMVSADGINAAWERVVASEVRYRAVIDIATLGG